MCEICAKAYVCKGCGGSTPWSHTLCPECLKKLGLEITNEHKVIPMYPHLERFRKTLLKTGYTEKI